MTIADAKQAIPGEDRIQFDFYGVIVSIDCDDAEVRVRIVTDFSYFRKPQGSPEHSDPPGDAIELRLNREAPKYDDLPNVRAKIYTPRNVCYPDGPVTYIDYFGKALAVNDTATGQFEVWSENVHVLHEIAFLTILSRVCGKLEKQGIHRVHALCVESQGRSALFMMPSGGGKTTLGLEFLSMDSPVRLVSEDSPLVNSKGETLPFPLRIGVKQRPEGIADEHITRIERMEFDPKHLISLDVFDGKLATGPSKPAFVFIGERMLGRGCTIREVGTFAGLSSLLRHMIIGVGLYQGVEFLLRSSIFEIFGMARVVYSRVLRAISLVRTARVLEIDLGRDPEHNHAEIVEFLKGEGFFSDQAGVSN